MKVSKVAVALVLSPLAFTSGADQTSPAAVRAGVASAPASGTYVEAHVIAGHPNVPPVFPAEAILQQQEGWVQLSVCIGVDGTIASPVVIKSSGPRAFEVAALAAVKTYRYAPATLEGEPITQCSAIFMNFQQKVLAFGARPEFARKLTEAQALITAKSYDKGAALADSLHPYNNYEGARVAGGRMTIARASGDTVAAVNHIRDALRIDHALEPDLTNRLLQLRFAMEIELGKYSDALKTYEAFAPHQVAVTPSQQAAYQRLRTLVDGEQPLVTHIALVPTTNAAPGSAIGNVGLLRRKFGFQDLQGAFDHFELRCLHYHYVAPVSGGNSWQVPESWGSCDLYLFGSAGATLTLVERPMPAQPGTVAASTATEGT